MFGLCVRFTCKDETSAAAYDRLVAETIKAIHAHEAAPHTRRYLDERDQYLASTEVDWLTLQTGKGIDG